MSERCRRARIARCRFRGFSLLETLLSLSIFSVAVVGIIEGIASHLRAERHAEEVTRAVMLAQNVLEEIRQEGLIQEEERSGRFQEENEGFAWQYMIAQSEWTGLYRVTVTVFWSDGMAGKDYTIETFLADRSNAAASATTPPRMGN